MANNKSKFLSSHNETLKISTYKSSGDIEVPDKIIDRIIGQKEARNS